MAPKPQKTRKTRKHTKAKDSTMTIPELRMAMHHIGDQAQKLSKTKNMDLQSATKHFRNEWEQTFHKPLSEKAARDYLLHIKSFSKTRKGKRGGANPLGSAPAPLAQRLDAGTDLPQGNFLEQVSKGFFVPMSDNIANCGKLNMGTAVPADMGDNRVGGGKKMKGAGILEDIASGINSIGFRPFSATNPPSIQETAMRDWKGLPTGPGGQTQETGRDYSQWQPAKIFPSVPIPASANQMYTASNAIPPATLL